MTLSLISTSDVPAYLAALTNAIGNSDGGTGTPILILFSNDTLIVKTTAADSFRTMYLHAPAAVTGFTVYTATDLTLPVLGTWNLAARLPHNNDPLAYNSLTTASNIFFTLGTDQDSDGDLLSDSDEILLYGTDAHLADTDGDGNDDRLELFAHGTSATSTDTDGDGVPDSSETDAGCTSPTSFNDFTVFELARILNLDAIKVSVTSSFASVYLNTSETATAGELLDTGLTALSPSGQRSRAPCEIGESGSYGSGTAQYTALAARPSDTVSQRVLRVYLDHWASTPGIITNGVAVRVDLDGASIIGTPSWNNNHDSTLATGPTAAANDSADHVTWSTDIAFKTNITTHTDGGWNQLDITYEPRLPHLTVSPTPKYVGVNTTAITYTATSSNLPYEGLIWWEVTPKVTGGPTIVGGTTPITRTNATIQLNPGSVPGTYVLTAKPSGLSAMGGAATVTVVKIVSDTSAESPADHSRTNLGVSEVVFLSLQPNSITDITWSVQGGGTFNDTSAADPTYYAPYTSSMATISATFPGGTCAKTFTIHEPTGHANAVILTTSSWGTGNAGAEMIISPTIGPTNVSFWDVFVMEKSCGVSNASGYFITHTAPSHDASNGAFREQQLRADNTLPVGDTCSLSNAPPPWTSGICEWHIPVVWWIEGGITNAMTTTIQQFQVDTNGTVSITKFGRTVSRTVGDVIETN